MGKLLRRDSGVLEKKKKAIQRVKINSDEANTNLPQLKKPLITKWITGANKLNISCIENDGKYCLNTVNKNSICFNLFKNTIN